MCDKKNTLKGKDKGGEEGGVAEVENIEERKQSLLASAKKFYKTTELLFNMPLIPTDDEAKFEAHHRLAGVFLSAICLELIIKIFWMAEKGKMVSKTHDVLSLFEALDQDTREHIENAFYNDEQRKGSYEHLRRSVKENAGRDLPSEEDFRKMLSGCRGIVVDYRYDSSALLKNKFLAHQHIGFLGRMLEELEQKIHPPAADTQ